MGETGKIKGVEKPAYCLLLPGIFGRAWGKTFIRSGAVVGRQIISGEVAAV